MCEIVSVELYALSTEFVLSKFALSITNVYFVIFSNRKSIENSISINGVSLQKVDSLRFLGFCVDHHVTWKDHIICI